MFNITFYICTNTNTIIFTVRTLLFLIFPVFSLVKLELSHPIDTEINQKSKEFNPRYAEIDIISAFVFGKWIKPILI